MLRPARRATSSSSAICWKPGAITCTGDTALIYNCENGYTDVAVLLLQYGYEKLIMFLNNFIT